MKYGTGHISGNVEDAGCRISAVPDELAPDGSNVQTTEAEEDGSFDVPNLPPGDYHVYAAEQTETWLWNQPAFLRSIEDLGMAVHLDESGAQTIRLSCLATGVLKPRAMAAGFNLH